MRQILTGIDPDGRSCVVAETVTDTARREPFYQTTTPPPPRPPGRGEFVDLGVPAGTARWAVFELAPDFRYGMHHTDTIDLDSLLAGSMTLILDDGRHPLSVGDCVVISGVDHAWEAGPEGCTMSFLFLGTPPPT